MLACAKSTGVVDKHVLLGWGSRPCLRNFQSCRRRRSLPYQIERGSKPLPDGKTTIEGIQIGIDSEKTFAPPYLRIQR